MKRDQENAKRMRHLRQAWGFQTSSAFAKFLGISEERWNNVENGYPVSVAVAKLLYEKADVSIDYTWRGGDADEASRLHSRRQIHRQDFLWPLKRGSENQRKPRSGA